MIKEFRAPVFASVLRSANRIALVFLAPIILNSGEATSYIRTYTVSNIAASVVIVAILNFLLRGHNRSLWNLIGAILVALGFLALHSFFGIVSATYFASICVLQIFTTNLKATNNYDLLLRVDLKISMLVVASVAGLVLTRKDVTFSTIILLEAIINLVGAALIFQSDRLVLGHNQFSVTRAEIIGFSEFFAVQVFDTFIWQRTEVMFLSNAMVQQIGYGLVAVNVVLLIPNAIIEKIFVSSKITVLRRKIEKRIVSVHSVYALSSLCVLVILITAKSTGIINDISLASILFLCIRAYAGFGSVFFKVLLFEHRQNAMNKFILMIGFLAIALYSAGYSLNLPDTYFLLVSSIAVITIGLITQVLATKLVYRDEQASISGADKSTRPTAP